MDQYHQWLLRCLDKKHPRYSEALVYQTRLTENIQSARHYGDTNDRKAERNEIITRLNNLALQTLDRSFNELCDPNLSTVPRQRSPALGSDQFKGILLLEAEEVFRSKDILEGWEAVSLARSSKGLLADFVQSQQLHSIELFLSVPVGLAVLLGHQWDAIGTKVNCYDWIGPPTGYVPAFSLYI